MDVENETDERHELEFILNHVLLPRHLSLANPSHINERKLMELMIKNVVDTPEMSVISPKTVELFQQVKRIHIDSSADNLHQTLTEEINALINTDATTFALLIQNCTMLIRNQDHALTVAIFCSDVKPINDYDIDIEVILKSSTGRF